MLMRNFKPEENMKESAIAIITARGGSKRIPRKNIREFCGKPILNYSIEAALDSGLFDEVMVSTDDEEIAGIARMAGAKVPMMRSSENANDYASTDDVLLEVLQWYKEQGREFEKFCCLYPTAPFVTAQKLQTAMGLLEKADSLTEFLGDFVAVVPTRNPKTCGLVKRKKERLYEVFHYTVEITDGKISDIRG